MNVSGFVFYPTNLYRLPACIHDPNTANLKDLLFGITSKSRDRRSTQSTLQKINPFLRLREI